MITLSTECQKVVDSVRLLAGHGAPSMFLFGVHQKTGFDITYIHFALSHWFQGKRVPENILEEILLAALNVQSETIHGIDWEALCGVDHKHQVKVLMGEL